MHVEEELNFLRKKVNKLEATIDFIQNDLKYKIASVLERFFDQRASHLAKQRKALQVEEDFCLDLLSCCADLPDTEYVAPTPSESVGAVSKRKRKENDTGNGKGKKKPTTPIPLLKPRTRNSHTLTRKNDDDDSRHSSANDFDGGDSDSDGDDGVIGDLDYEPSSIPGQLNLTSTNEEDIAIKKELEENPIPNSDEEVADEMDTTDANLGVNKRNSTTPDLWRTRQSLSSPSLHSTEEINDGSGIYLPKSQLDTIIAKSDGPTKLALNLIRALFKEDELIGHSLFGKICNANHITTPKPAIDSIKRDAIIGYVMKKYEPLEQTFRKKNKSKRGGGGLLPALHQSLGDYIRLVNRKARE